MSLDPTIARALSHPLRVEILERMQDEETSPAILAKKMDGVALGLIAYHVKVLEESGFVELVGTRPRRGAVEHFYRARPAGTLELRGLPRSLRGSVTASSLQRFIDAAAAALEAGTIDRRDDTVLSCMELGFDQQGWEQAVELGRALVEGYERIHEESRARVAADGGELTDVVVTVAGFEAADGTGRPD